MFNQSRLEPRGNGGGGRAVSSLQYVCREGLGDLLSIEGRNPLKAAVLVARLGGKFPCNLR